jgi:hypothetical protein
MPFLSQFGGGDWLKFSDVVIATVSLVLVGLLLNPILLVAFAPLNSNSMTDVADVIAFLAASLIVGYVFALEIQDESRIRAICSIVVLSSFAKLLFTGVWIANPFASPWFKDVLNSMYNTSGWTNYDWAAYSAVTVTADVVIVLAVSFIGLYAGSMLRKAKQR